MAQPWEQALASHAASVLKEMAERKAEDKRQQQQQAHNVNVGLNRDTAQGIPVPTTPSRTPSPSPKSPMSPKDVAAVAVEPHASSAPTAPNMHMTVEAVKRAHAIAPEARRHDEQSDVTTRKPAVAGEGANSNQERKTSAKRNPPQRPQSSGKLSAPPSQAASQSGGPAARPSLGGAKRTLSGCSI